jgi:hypothetical protein
MSGGFVKPQGGGQHQVVMFTFAGELKPEDVKAWNDAIRKLKKDFGNRVTGVTMSGHDSPPANP